MLACWVEDPNGDYFKKHLARIPDYIWVAEDGIKMQSFGSQEWDASFALQALLACNMTDELGPALKKGHEFVKDNPSGDFKKHVPPHFQGIMVGKFLIALQKMEPEQLFDFVNILLSLQSKNGGLAAWEPTGALEWLELLNPTEFFTDIVIEHE
ncbi:Beta-amyrin synthase [Vitis vinifera]|uniref:Beta-amyrin synthase n=1 Tax=Vitis vinifera TaxID=29760 RepID=A0A438J4C7_VITVI|nr:Beta-amyrin synthase [Vitis vinifera]